MNTPKRRISAYTRKRTIKRWFTVQEQPKHRSYKAPSCFPRNPFQTPRFVTFFYTSMRQSGTIELNEFSRFLGRGVAQVKDLTRLTNDVGNTCV